MKKVFTLLLMLCTTLGMSAVNYDIWVKGVRVTDSNKGDVLGDGKVVYYSNNNRLDFKDGTNITYNGCVVEANQELGIRTQGYVHLKSTGTAADNAVFSLKGAYNYKILSPSGFYGLALHLEAENSPCVVMNSASASLEISYITNLTMKTGDARCMIGADAKLSFSCVNAIFTCGDNYLPIKGFSSCSLNQCSVTNPANATYSTSSKYFASGGSAIYHTLTISAVYYGIKVNNLGVDASNCNNIAPGVKYTPSTNTLKLTDATINGQIWSDSNNLIIDLSGNNTVTISGSPTLYLRKSTTITSSDGTGVLNSKYTGTEEKYAAIKIYDGNTLTIKDCDVNATGGYWGIAGYTGSEKLIIEDTKGNKTKVKATGTTAGIANFSNVTPTGVWYTLPADGFYSTGAKAVYSNGTMTAAKDVEVGYRKFGISITGTELDTKNYQNRTDGVSFNPPTSALRLNNVNINNTKSGTSGINVTVPCNIELTGTNTIKSSGYVGLRIAANTTIKSANGQNGVLKVYSGGTDSSNPNSAIRIRECNLTIDNCHVIADASATYDARGIGGYRKVSAGETATLTIANNAIVEAYGYEANGKGAIGDIKSISLKDDEVFEIPRNGHLGSTYYIVDDFGYARTYEKIAPLTTYSLKVNDTQVTNATAENILNNSSRTVYYDDESKTLTLDKATFGSSSTSNGIAWDGSKKLNINVINDSKITSGKNGVYVSSPLGGVVFNGNGNTLDIISTATDTYAPINVLNGTVDINDCFLYLNANNSLGAIKSVNDGKNTISINDSQVNPTTTGLGAAIRGFKTINLNGASINATGRGIYSTKSMTINLGSNDSDIYASYGQGIFTDGEEANITINGTNYEKLYVNAMKLGYGGIMSGGDMSVKKANVQTVGHNYGIIGQDGSHTLTVEDSYVKCYADGDNGALKHFKNLVLKNAHLKEGVYNTSSKAVVDGTTMLTFVEILPGDATAIDAVTVDTDDDDAPAYDLRGVQVDKSYKGVVIKNGKKYMMK